MAWDSRQGVTAGTYQPRTGKASGGSAGYVVRRVTAWFEDGRITRFEDEKVR